ncbi:MAG: hypothetical protein AAGI22_21345 [Planctomycetota bacterium]
MNDVSNGFGSLLPHRVPELDAGGAPTGQVVTIRSIEDVVAHVRRGNPVLPPTVFPVDAVAPDGQPGNHFFAATFTQALDPLTILNPSPSSAPLSGAISVTSIDPLTGAALGVAGRAFVGGRSLVGPAVGSPPRLQLRQFVEVNADPVDPRYGSLRPVLDAGGEPIESDALGFPGVRSFVPGASALVTDRVFVFVADSDGDLTSAEAFPAGVQLRLAATTALRASNGRTLREGVVATATVGLDVLTPEVLTSPPPASAPHITPGDGDVDVDPTTRIRIEFTESVQPYSVGSIEGVGPAGLSSAIEILFGPPASTTTMPFHAVPLSPYDLTTYELVPGFAFPGRGPTFQSCDTFERVDVVLRTDSIEDLAQIESTDPNTPGVFEPNRNLLGASTFFETGEGPGMVNAPVAPDAIYVGRIGARPGLSVIDLNGFGQGTGNPVSSQPFPLEGESRFPYDPNVTQNPLIRPLLVPGECVIDGGSAGAFTLVRDTSLQDVVVRSPLVSAVADVHLGHALDGTLRNAPPPAGCQSGPGNVCAIDGLKVIRAATGGGSNTIQPSLVNQFGSVNPGYENLISWSPHPNPPKLAFPPPCVTPYIGGNSPTTVDAPPPNFLVPGNPFPVPGTNSPPTGLLVDEQNVFFQGPTFGGAVGACSEYMIRQQIGHFLYVADRPRGEIVVFNSNRMTVIDRIAVPDPTSMAIGPNLDVLAVTNQVADTVSFIDTDPRSTRFHQVIRTVQVGRAPRGIAFEPTNEDILVCNELDGSVSIISAASLDVRRTARSQLDRPFEVCVTPRMQSFSFRRGVYFAYVLNRSGNMAVFESGPNGVNGWGYDDIVGIIPFRFLAPKTVQIDPLNLDASVYVVHEGPIDPANGAPGDLGVGAISRLRIESSLTGQLPLTTTGVLNPNFRDVEFGVPVSIGQGPGGLSGVPVDIAFDDQKNFGGIAAPATNFSAGSALPANGKCTYRLPPTTTTAFNTTEPRFLFAAVPNPIGSNGVIDVLDVGATGTLRFDTNPYVPGVQSIPAPQVSVLSNFWRQ